ncbi:hypothetical protein MiYa_04566 [Microcystis aeruginosa NIES-2519]|uniref:Uncharacterized protein n=1 Tax=Microcystis aeruginosa NIES-2519 TaxID=2303981 RepID=A0A5A5RD77_MICAE|nr:hypothetical protein MiYa_04566 [Microcystis aeruginosa NIES-2519]GCA86365.1 hypothetical protein MiHa_04356 [Microcystis aeruginosa NIES-2522]
MKTIEIKLLTQLNNINIALPVAAQTISKVITQDIEGIIARDVQLKTTESGASHLCNK